MSKTQSLVRNPVPALSITLLVASALWLSATAAYYATSAFRPDWSATPLFWMLFVMITPAVCFAVGILLLDACKHSPVSRLAFSALISGFFPVTVGTVLAVWAGKSFFF